jgi:hypothetical protein
MIAAALRGALSTAPAAGTHPRHRLLSSEKCLDQDHRRPVTSITTSSHVLTVIERKRHRQPEERAQHPLCTLTWDQLNAYDVS